MTIKRMHVAGDKSGSKNGYEIKMTNGAVITGSWKTGGKTTIKGSSFNKFDKAQFKRSKFLLNCEQKDQLDIIKYNINNKFYVKTQKNKYLSNKGIADYEVLETRLGDLVVPIYDIRTNQLQSAQLIKPDGSKLFWPKLPIKYGFSKANNIKTNNDVLYICEGFATGATINMLTGCCAICCLSAFNLTLVSSSIRYKIGKKKIIIAADNDYAGIKYAKQAEQNLCCEIVIPAQVDYDFNDLYIFDEDIAKKVLTMS